MSKKFLSSGLASWNMFSNLVKEPSMLRSKFLQMQSPQNFTVSRASSAAAPQMSVWDDALEEAEQLVGCPASVSTLQSLFSNEFSVIGAHVKKLEGSTHPLLHIAREFMTHGKSHSQPRGLLVLLVADLVNHNVPRDILGKQKSLAEITEMIHTAHRIHKGVVNDQNGVGDIEYGNKIAILSGDYLLANAGSKLAAFNMTKVVDLMGSSISDFAESQFMGTLNAMDVPLPSHDFHLKQWEDKTFLATGSLIAKSCRSCALMASASEQVMADCFEFGRNLGMAWQAHLDCQMFSSNISIKSEFDMSSLPVVTHLSRDPQPFLSLYNESPDYAQLRQLVLDSGSIEDCKQLNTKYTKNALQILEKFPANNARQALMKITSAIHDSS